jgi:hypothetical protein
MTTTIRVAPRQAAASAPHRPAPPRGLPSNDFYNKPRTYGITNSAAFAKFEKLPRPDSEAGEPPSPGVILTDHTRQDFDQDSSPPRVLGATERTCVPATLRYYYRSSADQCEPHTRQPALYAGNRTGLPRA